MSLHMTQRSRLEPLEDLGPAKAKPEPARSRMIGQFQALLPFVFTDVSGIAQTTDGL